MSRAVIIVVALSLLIATVTCGSRSQLFAVFGSPQDSSGNQYQLAAVDPNTGVSSTVVALQAPKDQKIYGVDLFSFQGCLGVYVNKYASLSHSSTMGLLCRGDKNLSWPYDPLPQSIFTSNPLAWDVDSSLDALVILNQGLGLTVYFYKTGKITSWSNIQTVCSQSSWGFYYEANRTYFTVCAAQWLTITAYSINTGVQLWQRAIQVIVQNVLFDAHTGVLYGIGVDLTKSTISVGRVYEVSGRSVPALTPITFDPSQNKFVMLQLIPGLNQLAVFYTNLFYNSTVLYSLDGGASVYSWDGTMPPDNLQSLFAL